MRSEGKNFYYGSLHINPYEFDQDIFDDGAAPFLTPENKRWSVLEKLNRNHICQIRSCNDFVRIFNRRCLVSIVMLIVFTILLILLAKSVFFNASLLTPSYDFIIVGAGTAGCILARKLSDEGARVLLLEGGGLTQYVDPTPILPPSSLPPASLLGSDLTSFDVPFLWQAGLGYPDYTWDSEQGVKVGKGLGGTGVFGDMRYQRLSEKDLLTWRLPASYFTWNQLLSTYQAIEQFSNLTAGEGVHGVGGEMGVSPSLSSPLSQAFLASAQEVGLSFVQDFNDYRLNRTGVGYFQFFIKEGKRESTAGGYVLPLWGVKDSTLTLQTHSTVSSLLINTFEMREGKRESITSVYGVEYVQKGEGGEGAGREERKDRGGRVKRAILARRAFPGQKSNFDGKRSVILAAGALMSPKLLLLGGLVGGPVGVKDHPSLSLLYLPSTQLALSLPSLYSFPRMWTDYLLGEKSPLSSTGYAAGGFLLSPYSPPNSSPDLELALSITPSNLISVTLTLLSPERSQELSLSSSSSNINFLPLLSPLSLSDHDIQTLLWGVEQVRGIMSFPSMRALVEGEVSPGPEPPLREWVRAQATPSDHYVGSLPLGERVDRDFKLQGVEGLRVADASVIPSAPAGDPQATVQALAYLAADRILAS